MFSAAGMIDIHEASEPAHHEGGVEYRIKARMNQLVFTSRQELISLAPALMPSS
jgi:hypothetical protein